MCLGTGYGTMQGVMACVIAWTMERITCLGISHGMRHGKGDGTRHLSWLRLWHHARGHDTHHGTCGDTNHVSWHRLWHYAKGCGMRHR